MRSVIDFHTHFFSRPFFEALAADSPLPGDVDLRLERLAAETGLELPSASLDEHLGRWIGEMDRYGVRQLVSFASVAQEAVAVAQAASSSRGRVIPFAALDPTAPEAAERARSWFGGLGMAGVVLFPALHHFRIDGPEVQDVLNVLAEHAGIAVVHCGLLSVPLRDRLGLPRRYDVSLANPLHLIPAADANPGVSFVIPHFGAGFFRETLMVGRQCQNVFVDTSSSNSWMSLEPAPLRLADVFERSLAAFGPERILFGTDSGPFPRGWRHEILTNQREALGACGLGEDERQRILHKNAVELLGLE